MRNTSLATRLVLVVTILTLLMVAVAAVGYIGIKKGELQLSSTYDDQVITLRTLKQASDCYAVQLPALCRQVEAGSLSWPEALARASALRAQGDSAWRASAAAAERADEKAVVADATVLMGPLASALDHLHDILQKQDREQLQAFASTELPRVIDPLFAKLEQYSEIQRVQAGDKVTANESDEGSLKVELLTTTAIAVVLSVALGVMLVRVARALRGLVRQVEGAGLQVSTSVTEVAATAKEQQATANEIAASTSEIGATAKEISATSHELVKTMGDVAGGAEQAATLAGSGHGALARMEETMRHVMEAAAAINAKLGVLNEKAGNINQVVTTITKVADQTNLLSLNASIEAEKAGEYGRGFAVVATEIRRLADQTAVATSDIEQIVKEMLSAVSGSVMGMDKFSEEVRRSAEEVRNVSAQLGQIIEHVQGLTPQFETVNGGVRAQATGAQQISEALSQLSEAAQQTVESLRQSNVAIEQLNETARGLRTSIERIRT